MSENPDLPIAGLTRDLVRAFDHFRRRVANQVGMNAIELIALGDLYQFGPLMPRGLAERLGLTTGSVTALVDRLVAADLATRQPNPVDRRSLLICLSPPGHDLVASLFDGLAGSAAQALAAVPQAQRETILTYLRAATDALDELYQPND